MKIKKSNNDFLTFVDRKILILFWDFFNFPLSMSATSAASKKKEAS